MATIRKLRGRWQAQVRRRGMKPSPSSLSAHLLLIHQAPETVLPAVHPLKIRNI